MENSFTLDRQTLRDMRDVLDAIRREHGGSINASMTLQGISDSQVEMHLTDTDYIDTRVNSRYLLRLCILLSCVFRLRTLQRI